MATVVIRTSSIRLAKDVGMRLMALSAFPRGKVNKGNFAMIATARQGLCASWVQLVAGAVARFVNLFAIINVRMD